MKTLLIDTSCMLVVLPRRPFDTAPPTPPPSRRPSRRFPTDTTPLTPIGKKIYYSDWLKCWERLILMEEKLYLNCQKYSERSYCLGGFMKFCLYCRERLRRDRSRNWTWGYHEGWALKSCTCWRIHPAWVSSSGSGASADTETILPLFFVSLAESNVDGWHYTLLTSTISALWSEVNFSPFMLALLLEAPFLRTRKRLLLLNVTSPYCGHSDEPTRCLHKKNLFLNQTEHEHIKLVRSVR